ncbi:MAG: PfkB family carbohydrate kinase [Treponema sp.]|jgi:sugar/nucleoside kinase (ribokinase family)/phosphoglycolate phosphatase-like HAD superfamily hydrolase|nr:PfkB family carbohydrate kinase [Treponema sp.]
MDIHRVLPYKYPPSIAVIGDICLDLYYFAGTEGAEVSVETGLRSYSVFRSKQDLGAAGNVAAGCAGLGARKTDLYGVIGNDCWGKIVLDLLAKRGIGAGGVLIQDENWQTHVYHKIYLGREELPRYDMGNKNIPADKTAGVLLDLLESALGGYDCVIVNEQVPSGLHSPCFQEKLAALIERNRSRVLWFSDCRKLNNRYNYTIRKLNGREAAEILAARGASPEDAADPRFAARQLYEQWNLPVILTLGEDGALVQDEAGCAECNSLHLVKEIDTVGAGDAFLAGLVTARGAGLSLRDAALVGTFSAGVSMGKLFEAGHPEAEEVIALAEEGDFNYNPRLARGEASCCFAPGTEIEVICAGRQRGFPHAAIFDHDGTISVLRQGWEEVMYSTMVDAVSGRIGRSGVPRISAAELARIHGAVSSLIEKTTGIQTLAQMYQLRDLVTAFGYVRKEEILSPGEYKNIYNTALLASMERRLEDAGSGRLSADDLTVKGSVVFLKKLAAAGTKLYLASGTDEEDLRREAMLLGYADLFTGGIHGSLGDIKNDPKKMVIRDIIAGIRAAGGSGNEDRVVVFGDGPVEMREAKKAGLFAVGVLSDEKRRYGRNPAKRERLVLGGADILIPDFSWGSELARICGWE